MATRLPSCSPKKNTLTDSQKRWVERLATQTSFGRRTAQDAPRTPKPNSSEQKAIINTLRAPVEQELKQKVVFRIRRLKVQNGWAFLEAVPQQPDGKPVNYTITPHQTAIEAGGTLK